MSEEINIKKPLRFIVAGGGTGGHIFPAIAIANAIKQQRPSAQFLFVGAKSKMEMEKVPAAGYEIKGIDIAGYDRASLLKNIWLPLKVAQSFFQVSKILKEFKPDAVIGVGGYSSFPVVRAAQAKGIKTFIHESNSFAGKSNIMLGKNATKIFTAWPQMDAFFPAGKIELTGNPIRRAIIQNNITKEAALHHFNMMLHKKTVLSVGGSLGAQSINEAIAAHISDFDKNNLQLIWQTGKPYFEKAKIIATGRANVFVADFISEMEYAYAAADIVISRSGAMAMTELTALGKPTVFVPYPFAAEDHQTANAEILEKKGAARKVANDKVMTELMPAVLELADNMELRKQFSQNMKAIAVEDADEKIATTIIKSLEDN